METRNAVDCGIEKRWFVWQCATEPDKERYIGEKRGDVKPPCGMWQQTATRKWNQKGWQGVCKNPECNPNGKGRKKQLNRGNTLPEQGWFESREEAQNVADEKNAEEEHRRAIRSNHADFDIDLNPSELEVLL